jgi:poly(hydroxyalkanoate) depolymerase family esterase
MPGLSETIAALQRLKATTLFAQADSGGRLQETEAFGDNPGDLRMFSYTPEGTPPHAPLVVVLHGCGQHAESYAVAGGWVDLAERCGFALLAPEQTAQNNMNRCFNWFLPEDARRDGGEAASIKSMIDRMVRERHLDKRRVFVTGLSAGGAMTAVMLACYPEVFAAGAVVAGLPYGAAHNASEALAAMRRPDDLSSSALGDLVRQAAPASEYVPRLTIWQGDADWTVDVSNARRIAEQWANAQGLPAAPQTVDERPGVRRSVWHGLHDKRPAVELNIVFGLGHGAPLATQGPDGLGSVAPFMLEAGVSSTLEIARFWGLTAPEVAATTAPPRPKPHRPALSKAPPVASFMPPAQAVGRQALNSVRKYVTPETAKIIAGALKAARLLK